MTVGPPLRRPMPAYAGQPRGAITPRRVYPGGQSVSR